MNGAPGAAEARMSRTRLSRRTPSGGGKGTPQGPAIGKARSRVMHGSLQTSSGGSSACRPRSVHRDGREFLCGRPVPDQPPNRAEQRSRRSGGPVKRRRGWRWRCARPSTVLPRTSGSGIDRFNIRHTTTKPVLLMRQACCGLAFAAAGFASPSLGLSTKRPLTATTVSDSGPHRRCGAGL